MDLAQFVKATYKPNSYDTCFRKRIYCKDGFNMSVQGSSGHYCTPRKTQDWYMAMEIGYPSDKQDLLMEYAEQEGNPTDTVYGYVPVDIIQEVINNHGGIDVDKTFSEHTGANELQLKIK